MDWDRNQWGTIPSCWARYKRAPRPEDDSYFCPSPECLAFQTPAEEFFTPNSTAHSCRTPGLNWPLSPCHKLKDDPMERIHKVLTWVLTASFGGWLIVATSSLWLMTLGTDEAWNLNGLRSAIEADTPGLSSELIPTSGGLFAIANLIIQYVVGSQVWAHRLFSLLCYLALLMILVRQPWGCQSGVSSPISRWLLITPVLAVPGSAEISGMAVGSTSAVLLLVIVCVVWCRVPAPGIGRAILCGCLCGLSAASRFELILAVPALLLFLTIRRRIQARNGQRSNTSEVPEILFAVIAAAVFIANVALMNGFQIGEQLAYSTGLDSPHKFLFYPLLLNKVLVAQSFVPFGILVMLSVLPFWASTNAVAGQQSRNLSLLLLTIAWVLACAWFLQAPVPNFRYLWPSLVCFSIPAGFVMRDLYETATAESQALRKIGCLAIASALVAGSTAGSLRSVTMGEQDYVSWEWSREQCADWFYGFQHVKDQNAAAAFVRELPADAIVTCFMYPYPLRYITHRPILRMNDYAKEQSKHPGRLFLVLEPGTGIYEHLSPGAWLWMEEHCQLQAQFGRYSIFEVPAESLQTAPNRLHTLPREYSGHPSSEVWFGRTPAPDAL